MPMPVTTTPTEIPDVLVLQAGMARDDRGYFSEVFVAPVFDGLGIRGSFVQDNLSSSRKGTLRGMHYQIEPRSMGKLVRVLRGEVFDVAVDLRKGSPWFGKWVGRTLSEANGLALWIPAGFAHGFLATADDALVLYKCTATHAPEAERALSYRDPTIGIRWPAEPTLVSPKDEAAPPLDKADYNFMYSAP